MVQAVFDRPVTTIEFEQTCGIGLVGCQTGDAKDRLALLVVVFESQPHALDAGDLLDVREIEVVGELAGDPDRPGFQAPMPLINGLQRRGKKPAEGDSPGPDRVWVGSL